MSVSKAGAICAFTILILASFTHGSCDYQSRARWGASPVEDSTTYSTPSPAVVVQQIHSPRTNSCDSLRSCYALVKSIQYYYVNHLHESDLPCSFLFGGGGSAYEGRSWGVESNLGKNVVMCVIGEFQEKTPASRQISKLKEIIQCGVDGGHIASNYRVKALRDVAPNSNNPGDKLYEEIKKLPHYSSS